MKYFVCFFNRTSSVNDMNVKKMNFDDDAMAKMAKIHENAVDSFSEHLNSIDQHIQFTSEQEKDGRIPFLDTCVSINQDGSTKISVYRKPTHTDQYLNFQSNHHLQHKRAVVNTLMLRAQNLVTENDDRTRETQIKVINVGGSAKILTNVQTFRDCALHQWNVRYELRHDSRC